MRERHYHEMIANEYWKEETDSYSSCIMKAEEALEKLKEAGWKSPEEGGTDTEETLIKRCRDWIDKLCATGGRAWSLQVPANPNVDPDLLFSELIDRYESNVLKRRGRRWDTNHQKKENE